MLVSLMMANINKQNILLDEDPMLLVSVAGIYQYRHEMRDFIQMLFQTNRTSIRSF